jgi:formylglycine-generating enzyme required for sulfatase activity
MAGKIFINYRRDDSASHALAVAGYLENTFGKRNVFIDDRMQKGQDFEAVLKNKIRQCKVMIAIIGPNWVDACDGGSRRIDNPEDWVRLEIEWALARKIFVIPVLVAGATLPSKSDLPQSLQPLLKHHGATVTTNGFRDGMAGLARDVADLMARRPWGWMVAAAFALILGGYVVVAYLRPKEPPPVTPSPPGSGKSFQDWLADGSPCPYCPEMVVAPAGTFTMGSPSGEQGRDPGEVQVRVTIAGPFAVGKFAVTFEQWDACVADGGCNGYRPDDQGWGRGNRPVINVNWSDANAYAKWLSRKTGKIYRLLSEAEREYVTRARTPTPFWWGFNIGPHQANYDGNYTYGGGTKGEYRQRTVPVDNFEKNLWGLFNVHGNVWEWTEDCWNDSNQSNPGNGSARTTGDCSWRVVRGGSWNSDPQYLRAAYRNVSATESKLNNIGFRLARTLNP